MRRGILAIGLAVLASSSVRAATYDLTSYPYGMTDQQSAGVNNGSQACAPTSTYNSLAMLQSKYGIAGLTQPAGGGNSSAVNTINALGTAMGTNAGGTGDANMITGKINYINGQGLSNQIKVEYQSAAQNTVNRNTAAAQGQGSTIPTLTFLAQQLAAGQDVEMGFNWLNANGTPNGGHWVTVDYYDTDTNTIGFIDPWNDTPGGGASQLYTRNVSTYSLAAQYGQDAPGTYVEINYAGGAAGNGNDPGENPDGDTSGFVDVIVAESPVPEPASAGLFIAGAGLLALRRARRQCAAS